MAWIPDRFKLLSDRPGPSLHIQRLPHLLRLLLMYQANPIRASPSGIIFLENGSCPGDTGFLAAPPLAEGLLAHAKPTQIREPRAASSLREIRAFTHKVPPIW